MYVGGYTEGCPLPNQPGSLGSVGPKLISAYFEGYF